MNPNVKPNAKITSVALGGAVATILAWPLELVAEPPAAVVAALTTVCAFAAGYLRTEPDGD